MGKERSITLIGAGNLATQLAITLNGAGYRVEQVFSKSKNSAEALAKKVKASAITDLKKINQNSAIYIIAVKDDAIEKVAKTLKLKSGILVHTSGTISMNALKKSAKNIGVFYPLQTFSKEKKANFSGIPICIEANNKESASDLEYFAKSISKKVVKVNSEQRAKIHLAAVFACNFSNQMYAIAEDILKKEKLSLDILKPLIEETAGKIRDLSPAEAQTGPALRGDKRTMEAQLKMLGKNKDLKSIYKLISDRIQKKTKK